MAVEAPAWAKNALASFEDLVGTGAALCTSRSSSFICPASDGRDTRTHASIDLGSLDPFVEGLGHTANLGGNGFDSRPQRRGTRLDAPGPWEERVRGTSGGKLVTTSRS